MLNSLSPTFRTDDSARDLQADTAHHAEQDGLIPCTSCGDYTPPADLPQGWCYECWDSLGAEIQEGGVGVWPERKERVNA